MTKNKAVGPNLKTYYYYTNNNALKKDVRGIVVIATGIEGTGALYDEIGEYLDSKGYAMYAIDELGYGNTGKVSKKTYKNWKRKDFYFASYNVHALSVLAKINHPDAPVCLIGNDFGAMLSLFLLREFPEVVDKIVTIGWGTPRGQDYGFLLTSWIKKLFLYDDGVSSLSHASKNKRFMFRFERHEKYAWLTSDLDQLNKIKDARFVDTSGTIGHYYYYYKSKIFCPRFMRLKNTDRNTPMLFLSGDEDLLTKKGRKTLALEKFYKHRKFTNVSSMIISGRHELLFEKNRFDNLQIILNWFEEKDSFEVDMNIENKFDDIEIVATKNIDRPFNEGKKANEEVVEVEITPVEKPFMELQEAEDELLIKTNKGKNNI